MRPGGPPDTPARGATESRDLNYRHHFHAGNFADIVKHAALLAVLEALRADPGPLTVIDTHAGAGLYDLQGEMALKSGEAEAGIARLMAADAPPGALEPLRQAVRRLNGGEALKRYPGSPWLAAQGLRAGDRLIACELRPEDGEALRDGLGASAAALEVVIGDGFATAAERAPARDRTLVLIDPPFERADDYAQIRQAFATLLRRNPEAVVLVWAPLKDLETFDSLLRGLEALDPPPVLVVEARLRPLRDPMKMNGCALLMINAPASVEPLVAAASQWVVEALGEAGGEARVWTL